MWCDVVWCGGWVGGAREGMHFSQSKNARLLNCCCHCHHYRSWCYCCCFCGCRLAAIDVIVDVVGVVVTTAAVVVFRIDSKLLCRLVLLFFAPSLKLAIMKTFLILEKLFSFENFRSASKIISDRKFSRKVNFWNLFSQNSRWRSHRNFSPVIVFSAKFKPCCCFSLGRLSAVVLHPTTLFNFEHSGARTISPMD